MNKTTTAKRLQQIMSERNLKQIDIIKLAEPICQKFKVKIGRNDISQYISGKVEPRQNKIYILAKALNVNEAWLMGYDVPRKRNTTYLEYIDKINSLSDHEIKVIHAYRSKPDMQPAVDKILEIESDAKPHYTASPFIAADSGENITAEAPDIDTIIEIENMK